MSLESTDLYYDRGLGGNHWLWEENSSSFYLFTKHVLENYPNVFLGIDQICTSLGPKTIWSLKIYIKKWDWEIGF